MFQHQDKRMLDLCEMETTKMINKAIQDPARAVSDAVILSVLCMATNRPDESVWHENVRSPFQPPLRSLQWLDIYGSLSPNLVHVNGLRQLVALRGGLESIDLPGLASMIS
jgi:hypothetical protein